MLLFFFQDLPALNWTTIGNYSIGVVQLFVLLYILLKVIPSWKEIRLKEIDLRSKETETGLELAKGLGQLSNALNQVSTVTHDIAIEQRKATENTKILQRVNANESNQIANTVEILVERMDSLEETLKETGYETKPKAVKSPRS